MGVDVLTFGLGLRVYRVIGMSGLLAVCTMMIGAVWSDEKSVMDDELRGSDLGIGLVGFWMTGSVSACLCVMQVATTFCLEPLGFCMKRNAMRYLVNATVAFMLLHSAGLLFYALPGYQVLLMLSVSAMISYEMLFM